MSPRRLSLLTKQCSWTPLQHHHYYYCLHCHHLKVDIIIIIIIIIFVVVFVVFVAHQFLGSLGPPWSGDGGRERGTAREYCSSALQQVVVPHCYKFKNLFKNLPLTHLLSPPIISLFGGQIKTTLFSGMGSVLRGWEWWWTWTRGRRSDCTLIIIVRCLTNNSFRLSGDYFHLDNLWVIVGISSTIVIIIVSMLILQGIPTTKIASCLWKERWFRTISGACR